MNSRFVSALIAISATSIASVFFAASPILAQSPAPGVVPAPAAIKKAWEGLKTAYDSHKYSDPKKPKPYFFTPPATDWSFPTIDSPQFNDLQEVERALNLPLPMRPSLALIASGTYTEAPVIRSQNGTLTSKLTVMYGDNQIGGVPVRLRSYNGQLVGPTLRAKPGDTLVITVDNQLPLETQKDIPDTLHDFNYTNLHTHGLHVSPIFPGDDVLQTIVPHGTKNEPLLKSQLTYKIKIPEDHDCGTFWYHPHRHGSTAAQVASGMSGALIIEGGLDTLPAIMAAKERTMVLNQILYVIPKGEKEEKIGVIKEDTKNKVNTDKNLGPNDAETLGRFTTINGVQMPVIMMRPGQIERWRLIDSSQSEIIDLKLVKANTDEAVTLTEIAVDGLARGNGVKKESITMLPGYRSDVLVQIPDLGEYLLVDEAKLGMKANPLPRQYVARVIVQGDAVTGKMPEDTEMARYRRPTLANETNFGFQPATYSLVLQPDSVKPTATFTIDGKPFTLDNVRQLKLNTIDEWKVNVQNYKDQGKNKPKIKNKINTGHPFHIHVNPFEVTSIMGPEDQTDPTSNQVELLKDGPVWRDTIWVPNNGTVTFRTKYTDFVGKFVQHCHILDHEDQGMMQVVEVVDPKNPPKKTSKKTSSTPPIPAPGTPAPDFELLDPSGSHYHLKDMPASRRIVFFFKGHGCLHCAQQVQKFTALHEQFKARGIALVGITTDDAETLKAALKDAPCPFPILPDADAKTFKAYGCAPSDGPLLHGTFLLDEKGYVAWRTTGASPFLEVLTLLDWPPTPTPNTASR